MMYLALSYDHRMIDGREAVTFLVRVKECIEDPERCAGFGVSYPSHERGGSPSEARRSGVFAQHNRPPPARRFRGSPPSPL